MNLKIDRLLPYPPSLTQPYIFTFLPSLQALLLYPPPPLQEKQEEPNKKKFAFKGNSNAAPVMQEVFIFELSRNAWRTQQTKGKFPTRRQNPAVACMGPCMMVYGGKQLNPAKQVNDLYCLHLTNWQWKKLFAMQAPNPSPNPLAFAINDENLLVIGKELWVFCAKGVNWELQKGDLPGGIWQKVQGSQLSFEIRCGAKIGNDLIVFGWENKIKSASISLYTKTVTALSVEGEVQQAKGERLQIVNTSDGQGVMIDGVLFGSFTLEDKNIIYNQWTKSEEVAFDRIVPAYSQENNRNYGITLKKEIALVEIQIQKPHQEEQSLPITARQIQADYMKSSLIQNQLHQQLSSPIPRSSMKEQASPALSKHLGPLLAGQWMKRRILESKGNLLEESIKKAEKMVLMLCRYGSEEEKRIHINKVRRVREALSDSFAQETKWRNTMEDRKGETALKEFVLRQFGQVNPNFSDFQEE